MAIASLSPENNVEDRGNIPILGKRTSYQGKSGRRYDIEAHYSNGTAFKGHTVEHAKVTFFEVVRNYTRTYPGRDLRQSCLRALDSLKHQRTLVLLARAEDGAVIGHGILPRFYVNGEPYMYSSRAIQKGHEGEGLGTEFWRIGLGLHQEMVERQHRSMQGILLMTQTAASLRGLEILRELGIMDGKVYPIDKDYNTSRKAQDVMLAGHGQFRLMSQQLNLRTGVSRDELSELGPNESFVLREGTRTATLHAIMFLRKPTEGGLGMRKKDVVWAGLFRE